MRPLRLLDGTTTPFGLELELYQRGDEMTIRIDRWDLMSSRAHGSEEAMARLALEALDSPRPPELRWLIGGLGMGYTLRATLDVLDSLGDRRAGSVVVAEVFEAVVEWNRGPLAHLADRPLDDPRVRIEVTDVFDLLQPAEDLFDIILLDVDNGPEALTLGSNQRLYQDFGLRRLHRQLRPGGVLAVWSASDDRSFVARLERARFRVDRRRAHAREGRRGERHTIFVAKPRH